MVLAAACKSAIERFRFWRGCTIDVIADLELRYYMRYRILSFSASLTGRCWCGACGFSPAEDAIVALSTGTLCAIDTDRGHLWTRSVSR